MRMRPMSQKRPLAPEFLGGHHVEKMPASVLKILEGAVRVLGRRGLSDLSIESICRVSGVSRATLYRHFGTKDDLLDAVGEFICCGFEAGVTLEAEQHEDSTERFRAVMRFLRRYTAEHGLISIFEADPSFHLVFFRSHFARHRTAVQNALSPVFDAIETRRNFQVNRAASAERIVRLQLSSLLIPFDQGWDAAWVRAGSEGDELEHWVIAQRAADNRNHSRENI